MAELENPAMAPPASPLQTESILRDALREALSGNSAVVGRLSYARTSVHFTVDGASESVTLLLDRRPPQLAPAGEPA